MCHSQTCCDREQGEEPLCYRTKDFQFATPRESVYIKHKCCGVVVITLLSLSQCCLRMKSPYLLCRREFESVDMLAPSMKAKAVMWSSK